MSVESHTLEIWPLAAGSAIARSALADSDAAIVALAQASSQAAIASIHGAIASRQRLARFDVLAAPRGPAEAAALIARPLVYELCDELDSRGGAQCNVDVAVVDGEGRPLARLSFEYGLGGL